MLGRSSTRSMLKGMIVPDRRARFSGCLLGGAIGDALGAPVEFLDLATIRRNFGSQGVRGYEVAYGRNGAITDDTQMTLFTAEALLRLRVAERLGVAADPGTLACHAYLRWLRTQGVASNLALPDPGGLLLGIADLHAQRGPGLTCLSSLAQRTMVSGSPARNDRKGCGGVMRMAPVGLDAATDPVLAFERGRLFAAITHGHPTGSLAAGAFAAIISRVIAGSPLLAAVEATLGELERSPGHEQTSAAMRAARALASRGAPDAAAVESLGGGWIAEEALAIGLYAALVAPTFGAGVLLAVNHGGDSDSTGAIAGNLLGALHGLEELPDQWREEVELRDLVLQIADHLCEAPHWTVRDAERLADFYPPL